MRLLVCALLTAALVAPAAYGQQQRQVQAFQGSGTIHSFNAKQINMITAGNQPWVIKLAKATTVSVKGEGTPEMMRPGTVVRLYAKLDKRGAAIEPIREITLMSPREGFVPMMEIASDKADEAHEQEKKEEGAADQQNPEPRPAATPFDNIGSEQTEEPRGRAGRARRGDSDVEEGERYFIAGVLISARRGKLVINAGDKTKVRGELDDEAKIKVDFTTHLAARKGDKIEVTGQYEVQGEAIARNIEITLAPPEEDEQAEKKRPNRNRRDREREQEDGAERGEQAPGFGPQ